MMKERDEIYGLLDDITDRLGKWIAKSASHGLTRYAIRTPCVSVKR